jgi:hypothetical protein
LSKTAPENQYATASTRFNAQWNAMFERLKEYKEDDDKLLSSYKI